LAGCGQAPRAGQATPDDVASTPPVALALECGENDYVIDQEPHLGEPSQEDLVGGTYVGGAYRPTPMQALDYFLDIFPMYSEFEASQFEPWVDQVPNPLTSSEPVTYVLEIDSFRVAAAEISPMYGSWAATQFSICDAVTHAAS
jgi:hypothetical protein